MADLTKREKEVLTLKNERFSYEEIAEKLKISKDTVKLHLRHAMEKGFYSSKLRRFMTIESIVNVVLRTAGNPKEVLSAIREQIAPEADDCGATYSWFKNMFPEIDVELINSAMRRENPLLPAGEMLK